MDLSITGCARKNISFAQALKLISEAGGGCLRVEKGTWSTGPVEIGSNTTLILEKGAVVSFVPDFSLYRPVYTRWEGVDCYAMHPCMLIDKAENSCICGEGVVDGSGLAWWEEVRRKKKTSAGPESWLEKELAALNPGYDGQPGGGGGRACQFLRPSLLSVYKSKNIAVRGVSFINSPFWTVHILYSSNVSIEGISVKNPHDSPNTDGIDIDSSEDVRVSGSFIDVGDDGIAIKSGSGADGIASGIPSKNIFIENCVVHSAHGGVSIGSETAGGIRGVRVESCRFEGTDRGIRIKTRRGRGGIVEDLCFKNIFIKNALCPIAINMFYRCGCTDESMFSMSPRRVGVDTPVLKNIVFTGIEAIGCRGSVGFIAGLPEMPVRGILIADCSLGLAENPDVPVRDSEMTGGIADTDERSFRLMFCSLMTRNVKILGIRKPYLVEQGVELVEQV